MFFTASIGRGKRTAEWIVKHREALMLVLLGAGLITVGTAIFDAIRSSVEIGGDEGFEVTKSLLWANGYSLYGKFWNDQPPVFTVLLGTLFKCFGPSIVVARCLSAGFFLLLLAECFIQVRRSCGFGASWMATICLLCSPGVLFFGISVMLEVPAFAMAFCSLLPIHRWSATRQPLWLILSGILIATALQIKMTTALMVPALAIEIVLCSRGVGLKERTRDAAWNLIVWAITAAALFLVLGWLLGSGYNQAWVSHFSTETAHQSDAEFKAFTPRLIFAHAEAFWGAGVALFLVILNNDWRRTAFPLTFLLTALVIHYHHRPWWDYYYLHFAIPLSWLTGYAVSELFGIGAAVVKAKSTRRSLISFGSVVAAAALMSLILVDGSWRLSSDVDRLQSRERIESSNLLAKMRPFASRTHWAFAFDTIYTFHAGLLVPPEIAVLPSKRFWSRQITMDQVLGYLKQYQPEQILLSDTPLEKPWEEYLGRHYTQVYADEQYRLFVAKPLIGPQATNSYEGNSRNRNL